MTKAEKHKIYKKAYSKFKRNIDGAVRGECLCSCIRYAYPKIRECEEMSEFWSFQPDRGVYDYWTYSMDNREAYLFRETVLLFCIAMTGGKND